MSVSEIAVADSERRFLHERLPLLLLAYGLLVAVVGSALMLTRDPGYWDMLGTRLDGFQASLAVLRDGGPPLLGYQDGRPVPLGVSDDQGIYLYVPLLANLLGTGNPLDALRLLYVGLFAVPLLLYPLLFHRLFDSLVAAAIAPVGLLLSALLLQFHDIYWVPAWAALALLPAVMVLDRGRGPWAMAGLAGVVVAASFASSIRSSAGLAVALAAAIVVLLRPWSLPRKGAALALLLAAYLSVSGGVLALAREYRDARVADPSFAAQTLRSHPVWHTAYIGLGYLPNDENIRYFDEVAIATVDAEDAGITYLSPEYENVLRERVVDFVGDHPAHFVSLELQKAVVVVGHVTQMSKILPFAIAAVVYAFLAGPPGRRMRRALLLLAPALLLHFVPPLAAVPFGTYELGWYGAVALLGILAAAWVASRMEAGLGSAVLRRDWREAAGRVRAWLVGLPRSRPGRGALVAFAAAIALLASAVVAGGRIEDRATSWQAGFDRSQPLGERGAP